MLQCADNRWYTYLICNCAGLPYKLLPVGQEKRNELLGLFWKFVWADWLHSPVKYFLVCWNNCLVSLIPTLLSSSVLNEVEDTREKGSGNLLVVDKNNLDPHGTI